MTESKQVKQIKRLRDDAQERGMEPLLLLCYQEWLLRTMLSEVSVIANEVKKRIGK
jgi:hypothetical protein